MDKIEVLRDGKKEIEFWLNALSNENVDRESKVLLNKCLQQELHNYLLPKVTIKTDPMPIEKIYGSDTATMLFSK